MVKFVFVGFKKPGTTREAYLAGWEGEPHTSIVKRVPGITRWVQNHVKDGDAHAPDGVGEVWFENMEAYERAMNSPEMAAAFEEGSAWGDRDRSYGFVVEEKTIIGE